MSFSIVVLILAAFMASTHAAVAPNLPGHVDNELNFFRLGLNAILVEFLDFCLRGYLSVEPQNHSLTSFETIFAAFSILYLKYSFFEMFPEFMSSSLSGVNTVLLSLMFACVDWLVMGEGVSSFLGFFSAFLVCCVVNRMYRFTHETRWILFFLVLYLPAYYEHILRDWIGL